MIVGTAAYVVAGVLVAAMAVLCWAGWMSREILEDRP